MVDKYKTIVERMGAVWSDEMEKIIKALYSPEEADILSLFKMPYADQLTAQQISKKLKRPIEEIAPILNEMARTQRLFSAEKNNKKTYSMFPLLPGLFELFFSNHERASKEEKENLMVFAKEYEKYYTKGLILNTFKSSYPYMRVFVDQKIIEDTVSQGKGKLVNVNQEVELVKNDILPFEQAKNFIEKSRRISVMDCACRTHMKINNRGIAVNKYPINVCMTFNIWADYCIEQGFGKELAKPEAFETLSSAAKAGLVHTTQNILDKVLFICNCDRDCCVMLRGIRLFNNPRMVASSNFLPEYNLNNCKFCKQCVNLCPMNTIELIEEKTENKRISIDINRCIGCGVCAFNCVHGAIIMVKKFNKIPVSNFMEAAAKNIEGRTN